MTCTEAFKLLDEHIHLCLRCQEGGRVTGIVTYARMCSRARQMVLDCYKNVVTTGGYLDGLETEPGNAE